MTKTINIFEHLNFISIKCYHKIIPHDKKKCTYCVNLRQNRDSELL